MCGPVAPSEAPCDAASASPGEQSNVVVINVYDLGGIGWLKRVNSVSTVKNSLFLGGVFHVGVQVYGEEWGFGSTEADESGLYSCAPCGNPDHSYRAALEMGPTSLSLPEVRELLADMMVTWRGHEYDFIHHNCFDFANVCCARMGVGRIPGWVDRFRRVASTVDLATKMVCTPLRCNLKAFVSELKERCKKRKVASSLAALDQEPGRKRRRAALTASWKSLSKYRPRLGRAADVEAIAGV